MFASDTALHRHSGRIMTPTIIKLHVAGDAATLYAIAHEREQNA